MTSPDQRTIRTMCGKEWAGDFRLWDYCETQQLEALRTLQR